MILVGIIGFNNLSKKIFNNLSCDFIETSIYSNHPIDFPSTFIIDFYNPIDIKNIVSKKDVIISTITNPSLYIDACIQNRKHFIYGKNIENYTPDDLKKYLNNNPLN